MATSINDYIASSIETICVMPGYQSFRRDLNAWIEQKIPENMIDIIIAKNLLSNQYGNIVEQSLALHFRNYVQKNVESLGNPEYAG